jgi:hypothetical protein
MPPRGVCHTSLSELQGHGAAADQTTDRIPRKAARGQSLFRSDGIGTGL